MFSSALLLLQLINLIKLFGQVIHIESRIKVSAADAADQFHRRFDGAVPVNFVRQPANHGLKISRRDAGVHIQFFFHGLHELRAVGAADGIAGEVAEVSARPMAVLQNAARIIGHVDVVPAGDGWSFDPFAVSRKEGYLLGRGVADDKGPLVVALHAVAFWCEKLARENRQFPHTVRLLFGANEETNMGDVDYYRAHFDDPAFLFTPDADFPVCNGETGGIPGWLESAPVTDGRLVELAGGMAANAVPGVAHAVVRVGEGEGALPCAERLTWEDGGVLEATLEADGCLRIEAQGKSAHASLPHLGVNAVSLVVDYLLDRNLVSAQEHVFLEAARKLLSHTDGSGVGLACADEHFGALTIVGGVIKLEEDRLHLSFDSRYPTCITAARIEDAMRALAESAGGSVSVGHIMEPFLVDAQALAIQAMLRAYNQVTGEGAKPFTMGGATYAREFTAGASFGPAMPWLEMPEWAGGIHAPNEAASEEVLKTAFCAYACALFELMRIDLG